MSVAAAPLPCYYEAEGNPNGPTVFFLHGWPDTARVWQDLAKALSDDYYCVRVYNPLSSLKHTAPDVPMGGLTFDQVLVRLKITFDKVQSERAVPDTVGPYIVSHDWGAIYTHEFVHKYDGYIKKAVTMDIGGIQPKFVSVFDTVFKISYQWALCLSWALPSWLGGSLLNRVVACVVRAPYAPESNHMTYTYINLWKGMLGLDGKNPFYSIPYKNTSTPIFFMYANDKPFRFHSDEWLARLEKDPSSAHLGMKGQHWFFLKKENEPIVIDKIRGFLPLK
eukprot:PhM_4_TR7979/c0_g1_i2/m.106633